MSDFQFSTLENGLPVLVMTTNEGTYQIPVLGNAGVIVEPEKAGQQISEYMKRATSANQPGQLDDGTGSITVVYVLED